MAKNTGASKFRKVDVDQYDDNKFFEETEADADADSNGVNIQEVTDLLLQGKQVDALKLILSMGPVRSRKQVDKDEMASMAVRVLTSFKTMEIPAAVKSLDKKEVDVLMKYIYKGFEMPFDNSSAILLNWHEKAFAVGGSGSVIRVLTDTGRA